MDKEISNVKGSPASDKKRKSAKKKPLKVIKGIISNPVVYGVVLFFVVMALLVIVTFHYEGGVTMETMVDSIWNAIICFVAGYYDICVVTNIGRLCSLVMLIIGLLACTAFTGKVASVFMNAQMKKDKGLLKVRNMEDHFLLCGWRNSMDRILDSVLSSNTDLTPGMIVLVNDASSEQVEQLMGMPRFKGIHYVSGDFTEEDTLKRAGVENARRALIISDSAHEMSQLETDSRTVLGVLTMTNLNPSLYIAAELIDSKFESHLRVAHCDEIILTTNYEYSLLATASSGMGYSNVIKELIGDDDTSGILIEDIPMDYVGKTYGEYKSSVKNNGVPIGILLNTGNFYQRRKDALREAQMNPDVKTIVGNLKKVKTMKSNEPLFDPSDDYVIQKNCKGIFVKGKSA